MLDTAPSANDLAWLRAHVLRPRGGRADALRAELTVHVGRLRAAFVHWGLSIDQTSAMQVDKASEEAAAPSSLDYHLYLFGELLLEARFRDGPNPAPDLEELPWPSRLLASRKAPVWHELAVRAAWRARLLDRHWRTASTDGVLVRSITIEHGEGRAERMPKAALVGTPLRDHPSPFEPVVEIFELGFWARTLDHSGAVSVINGE